jgi:UTP--glucose-1-phosphate uridylyltransferase
MNKKIANIRTLVVPAAGLGKRLRPLTYTTPKNLLNLAGKPIVEYVVEEACDAGIENVVLVVSPRDKRRFEVYVRGAKKRFPSISFFIRTQLKPFGNGHAVLQAEGLIAKRPFAVRFPDDVILGKASVLASLVDAFRKRKASVLLLKRVPQRDVSRYGVVKVKKAAPSLYRIFDFVEKPPRRDAPSNLAIIGGYVLTPPVLRHLKRLSKHMRRVEDGLWLVDAFKSHIASGMPFYGMEFKGKRLDCGSLPGFLEAKEYMKQRARKRSFRG